ncbi:MFS transporter [Ochrobactrum sp. EDr1-4]|uniref:MFS transporter n=1 Tax=Ochrobactrum sp. EDr1-4 TaxID=3368622 RepID=UPI003BA0117A
MSSTEYVATTTAAKEYPAHSRRSTLSGFIGTALEYYDFVIYGLAAATVFNTLFFPSINPTLGLLASFATYAVGFAVRPIGGLWLGALGDRIGRKKILVITIVLMGVSTFIIGLLPTYAQIGIWAPILLLTMRIFQGFGAGAELASASALLVESAPVERRGFIGSLLCIGTNTGTLIASTVWLAVSLLPQEQLLSWGWRLPFLASFLVAAWGLWMRRGVQESATFTEVAKKQEHKSLKQIYAGVFGQGRKAFLTCFGLRLGEGGTSIIYQVFLVGYIATLPNATKATGTMALVIASIFAYLSIPIIGKLIDRHGRRPVFMALAGFQTLFAFPGLYMINTGNQYLIILAFVLAFGTCVLGMYAIASSWMAEMFGSRYRLAGITASKEIGGLLGAGIAPFVCAALMSTFQAWWPIALYITVLAGISFVSACLAPETIGRDLVDERDAV